jgi:hypothetical protein
MRWHVFPENWSKAEPLANQPIRAMQKKSDTYCMGQTTWVDDGILMG